MLGQLALASHQEGKGSEGDSDFGDLSKGHHCVEISPRAVSQAFGRSVRALVRHRPLKQVPDGEVGEQRSGELGVTPGYTQGEGYHSSTWNKKATLRIQRVLLQAQALGRHQHCVAPPPVPPPLCSFPLGPLQWGGVHYSHAFVCF